MTGPNPSGLCMCGCGEPAPISTYTSRPRGYVKGEPRRFIHGHNSVGRKKPNRYVIEDRGYVTPCWIWQLSVTSHGYGHLRLNGRDAMAHRASYEDAKGPIPAGLTLDHLCRVPACINPDHLDPVTQAENVRRGLATKLTAEQVAEIRESSESSRATGQRFGISGTYVSAIRRGGAWKDAA